MEEEEGSRKMLPIAIAIGRKKSGNFYIFTYVDGINIIIVYSNKNIKMKDTMENEK